MQAGLYKHWKGGLYQVLGLAQHSETEERLVIYVALRPGVGPRLFARPLAQWDELMAGPDGPVPRFVYVGDDT